jgi:hypothetical protein
MSVDLAAIRGKIADTLTTMGAFNHVDAYEQTSRTNSEMPLAQVWLDGAEQPAPGEPRGAFGSYTHSFSWRLRCYLPLDEDDAGQAAADTLTIGLFAAFNDAANPLAVSGLVDSWTLLRVEPIPLIPDDPSKRRALLVEGTLITEAHG